MTVAYTDIVGFNQSTFDTLVKSNTAAAEGVQNSPSTLSTTQANHRRRSRRQQKVIFCKDAD